MVDKQSQQKWPRLDTFLLGKLRTQLNSVGVRGMFVKFEPGLCLMFIENWAPQFLLKLIAAAERVGIPADMVRFRHAIPQEKPQRKEDTHAHKTPSNSSRYYRRLR